MRVRRAFIPFLIILNLLMTACVYIVLPEGLDLKTTNKSKGWSAAVTGVSKSAAGDLHIDLTIRNETGDWSAMKAVEGKPAVLTTGDGKAHSCGTVFVGTGGHRLAPGFQMRGYIAGMKAEPKIQMIFVECAGIEADKGSRLAVEYIAFNGELNYYQQENGQENGSIKVELDKIEENLTYPVYQQIDGLIQKPDAAINALSDNVISLVDVQRTSDGFEFKWQNVNPTEFALKIHIGNPPVIGSDGILYGYYEVMDLVSSPLTPAEGKTEWMTKAVVPQDAKGFYLLASVESKNMRLYVSHAIDISDK